MYVCFFFRFVSFCLSSLYPTQQCRSESNVEEFLICAGGFFGGTTVKHICNPPLAQKPTWAKTRFVNSISSGALVKQYLLTKYVRALMSQLRDVE